MLSVGALIWASCRPLLRLVICVGCGFVITKADIFPPVAARGAGQIMLNIALPCLMFSKIVPAFTADNISALGPLVLVAFLYEAIGVLIAWIVGQLFWVPHRFRYGLLVAGGWGNYGDIPTSVIMSITAAAPFNGIHDQNLSVAYISAFILVFMMTLFPLGGHRWIAMDYVGPDIEDEEVWERIRQKRRALLFGGPRLISRLIRGRPTSEDKEDNGYQEKHEFQEKEPIGTKDEYMGNTLGRHQRGQSSMHGRHVAFHDDATTVAPTEGIASQFCSPAPTEYGLQTRGNSPEPTLIAVESRLATPRDQQQPALPTSLPRTGSSPTPPLDGVLRRRKVVFTQIRSFLRSILSPASVSIIIAFLIALVPTLKALFVEVPGTHIHPAPDGQPPLAVLIDTATFIGAASVPLGLICLGSALARLNVPRNQWGTLPMGAIIWLAVGKIFVMPVLGVLICQGLVSVGLIPKEDKVLLFVCIFFSCLPTATTQVFLTQVYSGTGSAEHLSAFLIPQYIFMFVSMTALTAYTLQVVLV